MSIEVVTAAAFTGYMHLYYEAEITAFTIDYHHKSGLHFTIYGFPISTYFNEIFAVPVD